MSNVIPIVSSSPPPLDDDTDYKWDDESDDYGNFTSAPSVSATTVTSDSSFEVNWSNSDQSTGDGFIKESTMKNGSQMFYDRDCINISDIDGKSSENIIADNLRSSRSLSETSSHGNDCDVVEKNEDFQDFANFGSAEFSESPQQASGERTENTSSPHQGISLSPTRNGSGTNVEEEAEDDDFQEFAQFNDVATTGNGQDLKTYIPEFTELEGNQILQVSGHGHSNKEGHVSSPETAVTGIESPDSVHMKNNDSIYSSASTVDSGVFSADLSPSCHTGETSDISLDTEKEGRLLHTNASSIQAIIPTLSAGRSRDEADSPEASQEHCQTIASLDNSINNNISNISEVYVLSDTSSYHCSDNVVSGSDNGKNNQQSGLSRSGTAGGWADVREDELYVDQSSGKGTHDTGSDICDRDQDNYTSSQKVEELNCSRSFTQDESSVAHTDCSVGFLGPSKVVEQAVGDSVTSGDIVEGAIEDVSLHHSENLRENGNDKTVVYEDGVVCNIERHEDCKPADLDPDDASVASEFDCKTVGFQENVPDSGPSVDSNSCVASVDLSDTETSHENVEDINEDEEFGDFGSCKGQTEDDSSNEVAPITFRTSVCETTESEGEDDFTFGRERPPVLDDEVDSNSDEFGGASKVISDVDNKDDFGDFDSAQNFHPGGSSSGVNKSVDDFGDFGRSDSADDDDGWADFGAASASSEVFGSSSSFTKSQASLPAIHSEQSKTQKLQQAVISCFPETPPQTTLDHPQVDGVKDDGSEEHSQNDEHGTSSLKDDGGPLPLEIVVDLGLSKALEARQQTWTVVQHPAKKDPKVRLWAHLKDVDSCRALMYGWHASHCSKEVFATLHIDTQNILFTQKKQAVPFFASGLGILEPIRGGGPLDRKKEKSSIPATQTTLLESSKYDYHQGSAIQDIPPVDFDWGSSGLTNPLTANTLDLDFLLIQGSDSYEKTSVFKADDQESAPSALQPLEEMLKKTTPTVKRAVNEVLSSEAVRVLDKMPDLSFMQCRVLMFPVKQ